MAEWTRSTPWRQGSILDQVTLDALRAQSPAVPDADIGIVITHDCDIAASITTEPVIEIVPGRFVEEENGSFTHSKDPRTLHLTIQERTTTAQRVVELKAPGKCPLPKEQLADSVPSTQFALAAKELTILRRWLAARYRRHAFPDTFEEAFDKVEGKFRDILKGSSNHLRAVLFDLDEDSRATTESGGPYYRLDIYLIYTNQPNHDASHNAAQTAKVKIEKAFRDKYRPAGEWQQIELTSCEVMSDNALPYALYLNLVEWRAEGLSLRSDPFGPMTEENA